MYFLRVDSCSLLSYVVGNMEKFQINSDTQNINTRHKHCFLTPNANLASYQVGAYFAGYSTFFHPVLKYLSI
jgi:hypothetical protein